jgi:hypothetical protein
MPIYTNKFIAEKYWKENLRFEEFHNTKREKDYEGKDTRCNKEWCLSGDPKANGDMRLVVDMREFNQFMVQKHFKMEGTCTLQGLIRKNNFAILFDLKEAYNHVPVHPTFQNLLRIIHGNYIYISGNSFRPEQCPMGIHPNNEKMCNDDSRDLED